MIDALVLGSAEALSRKKYFNKEIIRGSWL